ncbi:lipopolysaccharide biosynthesis protein [Parapedobacter sp. 2B3]|uniref:lipopolysaccharide biosynthesis protein n=1 Tax=Parapedobacter sp. 2B3 TaxID=3342381 RepID=UPI0035B67BEB
MSTEPTAHIEDEISVKDLIISMQGWVSYIWSKWRVLLVAGILGALLGLCYSLWKKPQYIATTTFVLESGDAKGLSQYAGMAAMVGIDLGGGTSGLFQGDNILELYRSRLMLAQTLLSPVHLDSNELLIDRYIAFNKIKESWEDDPELSLIDFHQNPIQLDIKTQRLRDSIITEFTNKIKDNLLSVDKPDKKLSIIQVQVKSTDEIFSKTFNENLVRRVNEFYIQTRTKKSTNNIAILERKVDSVRAVMEKAIYSAARVSDATPNLNPTRQIQRLAPVQEAQFSAEANKAMLTHLLQNLELTKMNLLQEQPLIQLVDQPVYPLKEDKTGKAKGIIIGGVFVGFLMLIFLVFRKWYRDVMRESR